jgi:hypothetical protein
MSGRWYEALRPVCEEVCSDTECVYTTDVVLFYLARWCQKQASTQDPDLASFEQPKLRDVAERIARNLRDYGTVVERIVQKDPLEWTSLRDMLLESARTRVRADPEDYAHGALVKVARALGTGTTPSQAANRLRQSLDGPRNEYVFEAPFPYWARRVVINLVMDGLVVLGREGGDRSLLDLASTPEDLDDDALTGACAALPGLVDAIRCLPSKQRSVMILSLARQDVDELVRELLHKVAPDLFSDADVTHPRFSSDEDIARHLETTPRRVAANRSAARSKLSARDPHWKLLLDALMPHHSTRQSATGPER